MTSTTKALLDSFETLELDAETFTHADHVSVAFTMLGKYDFVEACARYARTIEKMTEAVGVPEKYNVTVTFAFMSVIAERKAGFTQDDPGASIEANPDLLEADVLSKWYSKGRLTSPLARTQFLLPHGPLSLTPFS